MWSENMKVKEYKIVKGEYGFSCDEEILPEHD